mgnify:CR=1 FL=1|jgi:hypothetical protein
MGARIAMMRLGRNNRRDHRKELDFTMDLAIRERPTPATGGVNAPWTAPSQARADQLR